MSFLRAQNTPPFFFKSPNMLLEQLFTPKLMVVTRNCHYACSNNRAKFEQFSANEVEFLRSFLSLSVRVAVRFSGKVGIQQKVTAN